MYTSANHKYYNPNCEEKFLKYFIWKRKNGDNQSIDWLTDNVSSEFFSYTHLYPLPYINMSWIMNICLQTC